MTAEQTLRLGHQFLTLEIKQRENFQPQIPTLHTYHYRVRAFNDGAPGGEWAPTSKSFTTGTTNKPVAANGKLTNATGSTATLSGKLSSLGTGIINQAPYRLEDDDDARTEFPGITLWLDASDSSTITTGSGTNVSNMANKVDSTVKLYASSSAQAIEALMVLVPQLLTPMNAWTQRKILPRVPMEPSWDKRCNK